MQKCRNAGMQNCGKCRNALMQKCKSRSPSHSAVPVFGILAFLDLAI
jgi:hypothetical protein